VLSTETLRSLGHRHRGSTDRTVPRRSLEPERRVALSSGRTFGVWMCVIGEELRPPIAQTPGPRFWVGAVVLIKADRPRKFHCEWGFGCSLGERASQGFLPLPVQHQREMFSGPRLCNWRGRSSSMHTSKKNAKTFCRKVKALGVPVRLIWGPSFRIRTFPRRSMAPEATQRLKFGKPRVSLTLVKAGHGAAKASETQQVAYGDAVRKFWTD